MTDPKMLRRAFLLAAGDQHRAESRLSEIRMEAHALETRIQECQELKAALASVVCAACAGNGHVQHWYAQDDVKSETCTRCKGTGLFEIA